MKYFYIFLLIAPFAIIGQQATIHFEIKNATGENIEFSLWGDYSNPTVLFGEPYIYAPIINGKTDWTYQLSKPVRIKFFYNSVNLESEFEYSFFLSPGDELNFTIDEQKINESPLITGKGSENNQPLIQSLHDQFSNKIYTLYPNDSVPDKILKTITDKNAHNQLVLNAYIDKFQPTQAFVNNEINYLQYFTLTNYKYYKEYHKYDLGKLYTRNESKWQSIEDSLIKQNPINNDEILYTSEYAAFLSSYVGRTKERIWTHPELENEYLITLLDKQLYASDPENSLKEKIINKLFTGKTAEFLYADLFQTQNNPKEDNLPEIFERFKLRYPNSIYLPYIEPRISRIIESRKNVLQNQTTLISNSDSFQTFEDVLELVKGKTVLLDMWGTWCGPCRRDLSNHTAEIKNYFKDKPLDYLYIANDDSLNEEKWRELIPYYNLTGTHILANTNLSRDILTKLNSYGYPTYAIIKKDGTFELFEGDSGMKPEILFQQIDRILEEEK